VFSGQFVALGRDPRASTLDASGSCREMPRGISLNSVIARRWPYSDLAVAAPALAWWGEGKESRGLREMTDCGVRWGATITQAREWIGERVPAWDVTVESEPLSAPLGDAIVGRFANAAARLAPGAAAGCSRNENRLGLTMTVCAPGVDDAADSAAHAFGRALAAALWPRYKPARDAQWRVQVAPADTTSVAA
jgi:hypothetical protein